jgi:Gas vesicle protein G
MFLIDSLLVGGLRFVLDKLAVAAEQELDSVDNLQQALVETQLRLEEGEITEEEFAETERTLLARIRELKGLTTGGVADAESFEGIEITVDAPDER